MHVVGIHVSPGGLPKRPVPSAQVTRAGLVGDQQQNLRYHGGPERAVSLYSAELVRRLAGEGHAITPGAAGENVLLEGVEDWAALVPGTRLSFEGGVVLEIASYCAPCKKLRALFVAEGYERMSQKRYPGESRLYARVLSEGTLVEGATVTLQAPDAP